MSLSNVKPGKLFKIRVLNGDGNYHKKIWLDDFSLSSIDDNSIILLLKLKGYFYINNCYDIKFLHRNKICEARIYISKLVLNELCKTSE